MRVIGYVLIDGFYLWALGSAALLAPADLALVHRDGMVIDVSAAAEARGIRRGMLLAEAKAILSGEATFIAWEEEPYRAAQAAWLERVAEIADVIEPDGQHAAYLDLSDHPKAHDLLGGLRERLAGEFRFIVRTGMAMSGWVAREAARRGDESRAALAIPKRFVASLPTTALPLPNAVAERLVRLGYATVGDVSRIDLDTLRSQFGEQAHEIHRLALGEGSLVVKPIFPRDALSERWLFESPPDDWEVLEAALVKLARRLGNALRANDASAKKVELFLEREDGELDIRRRTFGKPIAGAAFLEAALRLMLTELPETPIASLRIRLMELERSRLVQPGLVAGLRSDRDRSMAAALANARGAFGDHAVVLGKDMAEPRFRCVRRAYSVGNGWTWG